MLYYVPSLQVVLHPRHCFWSQSCFSFPLLRLDITCCSRMFGHGWPSSGVIHQALRIHDPTTPCVCCCRMLSYTMYVQKVILSPRLYPSFLFMSGLCVLVSTACTASLIFLCHVLDSLATYIAFTSAPAILCLFLFLCCALL